MNVKVKRKKQRKDKLGIKKSVGKVSEFKAQIKKGQYFVSVVCNRSMYKKNLSQNGKLQC